MDRSIFFLTLCFVCIWLVVDVALGKDYLGNFLSTVFPFMGDSSPMTDTQDTSNSSDTIKAEWGNK